MRTLLVACAAALTLTGCQSTEEKIKARYMNWFASCGYPQGSTIPYDEEAAVVACVRDLEASYQTERSQNIARGAAMLGTAQLSCRLLHQCRLRLFPDRR